ncbi:radiation-inducible immediate-early gene IEX-1 [Lepisosteus oculatus]|uniref:radiation-inducible immediate-early gene IEX-1 n=1 Tax=Lepisosteus oculatus TaxID=7918 RepID=UPI00371D4005
MYVRSDSLVLSVPAGSCYPEYSSYRPLPRRTEPEIFTFEPVAVLEQRRSSLLRPRKKTTRVMYPSKVRKYLPPAEKSPAKRWLLALCLVLSWQIYTEDPTAEPAAPAESGAPAAPGGEDLSSRYQFLPFLSAELPLPEVESFAAQGPQEQEEERAAGAEVPSGGAEAEGAPGPDENVTCPGWLSDATGSSPRSGKDGCALDVLSPLYPTM